MRVWISAIVLGLLGSACTGSQPSAESDSPSNATIPNVPAGQARDFGQPPVVRDGDLDPEASAALEQLFGEELQDGFFDSEDGAALDVLGASGDVRVAWLLSDLLRFVPGDDTRPRIARNLNQVMELDLRPADDWQAITDHLIAWDVPAPPDYLRHKKRLFTLVVPQWEPLFDDTSDVDWRHVSWGGVGIDDRPYDRTDEFCRCIPAADNPSVTDSDGGAWYPDDRYVFGVVINDQARAYPKNIMEIREMVNDSLGGRDFAMPYCTLCGSAQVFLTDDVTNFERPVMRTSGLLSRSNKVMFDLETMSVFDTFTGQAVTGPMADAGVVLPQASVVVATWGEWKAEHPQTTILAQELDNGRGLDPLRGRDDDGPIFPIGDVDPRLPVQEQVLGVISPETGQPVAFHVPTAVAVLANGEEIVVGDISLEADGDGIRAVGADGADLGSHQSFWFAWSQFHPDTRLWPGN